MEVCIFCGSSSGSNPRFEYAAREIGKHLAELKVSIVYGGGKVGLMGVVADAALAGGGCVVGVMPRHLVEREIAHAGLTSLLEVGTMHERKLAMSMRADAFLALPGGAGTLEELLEQWTWAQLGVHKKPCALLNVEGYFDPLLAMIDKMVSEGFLKAEYRDMLIVDTDVGRIVEAFHAYMPPQQKWRETTRM